MMQRGRMYFNLLFTEQRHRLDGFILWIYVQDGIRLLEKAAGVDSSGLSSRGSPQWTIFATLFCGRRQKRSVCYRLKRQT